MSTTKKQTTTSKVQKSKVTFKNGKNVVSESLIRHSFEPLFSPKDGKARLTFCGLEHSFNNEKEMVDGKLETKQVPRLVIVFSCLDVTHDDPKNIAIRVRYNLSKTNTLGRFLALLGYENKVTSEIVDAESEYGTKIKRTDPREIFDFLRDKCGLVFKAEMEKAQGVNRKGKTYEKSLWNILIDTIEPMMKDNQQVRDMLASDVTDEDFEAPQIDMAHDE